MTSKDKPSKSTETGAATKGADKPEPKRSQKDAPHAAEDRLQKTDRPGFDLGGASDDTHAGTGLGLGQNSSDTAGERRLPGRRPDNKLTIPRWSGPAPKDAKAAAKKPSDRKT
jgi:hypothetical protein